MDMNVEQIVARAHELHADGYNCAQAVACAIAPQMDVDADQLFRALEGFGLGMGDMSQTCGAISGAVAVVGLSNSNGSDGPRSKGATYKISREVPQRFGRQNGTTVCRELKGVDTGSPVRSCPDCIEDAVRIVLDLI